MTKDGDFTMKKFEAKTILFLILIFFLGIFAFILLVGYLLNEASKSKGLQGFQVAISFLGIFATFGGAFLGAYLSGIFALTTTEKTQKIKLENDLKKLQVSIYINIVAIDNILDTITYDKKLKLKKEKMLNYLVENTEIVEKYLENKEKIIDCWRRSINPETFKVKNSIVKFEMDTNEKIEQTIKFLDNISSNFYLLNIQSGENDNLLLLYNYKKYLIELNKLINDDGTGGNLRIKTLTEEASFKLPLIYYYHNLIHKKIKL